MSTVRMQPGAYYHEGGSDIVFGLWFLTGRGKWLFSVPVEGSVWKIADDQTGEGKKPLNPARESCGKTPGGVPCESKKPGHKVHWANT